MAYSLPLAHQFVIGANPFTVGNSLPHAYTYGFIAPLLAAFVSKIIHADLGLTQHLITFVCLVFIAFIVGKEIFQATKSVVLVFVSLVIVLLYNSVSFRPESLAILLTVFMLSVVNHNRALSWKKILLLSLSTITLFYIKQYFLLLLPVLAVYFIFNQSKKNLMYLLVITGMLGIASFVLISKLFPLYFLETIVNHVNIGSAGADWMVRQSIAFIQLNWVILLLFVGSTLIGFIKDMDMHLNITDINKPLFTVPDTPLSNVYFIYSVVAIIFSFYLFR